MITEPQICSNAPSRRAGRWICDGVAYEFPWTGARCPDSSTPTNQIQVNRNQLQVKSVEAILWDQTTLTARFQGAGSEKTTSSVASRGGQEFSNPIRTSYVAKSVPAANLANPNPQYAVFAGTAYIASATHAKSRSGSASFVDTLHLGKLFELSGGVRWDYFDTIFSLYQPVPPPSGGTVTPAILNANGTPLHQIVHKPTYRAAFVYKPTSHGSVYFDYGTSFNPSAETLALSVSSSILPPEENEDVRSWSEVQLSE